MANTSVHPQAAEEYAHLTQTLTLIREETEKLEEDTGVRAGEERVVAAPEGMGIDEEVQFHIFQGKVTQLHQLFLSQNQPYFARLDFTADGQNEKTYYLGRWGVMKTPSYDVKVVDWRSPLANLYYSGQIGRVEYEAPDGCIRGELSLKRMFTIHKSQMEAMFDTGLAGQESYLEGVLGQVSSSRLKEIVTTIQAEQNRVIRHPLNRSLIVQGVAGSGKTTIALHRIAWLLYAYQKTLSPEKLMILAPNPLFLNYISAVLPDLGVEQVKQTTYARLGSQMAGKGMCRLLSVSHLEKRLCMTETERKRTDRLLQKKGSLAFGQKLLDYLETFEQKAVPQGDLHFGENVLFTYDHVQRIYMTQLKPFPLQARKKELKKYIVTRLKTVEKELTDRLQEMCNIKLELLLQKYPDGAERREKVTRLLDARNERLLELQTAAKALPEQYLATFPDMAPLAVYQAFLESMPEYSDIMQDMQSTFDKNAAYAEDVPALLLIAEKTIGLKKPEVRHLVVDEAQDLSPLHYFVLRHLYPYATCTFVGDLMQGIYGAEGITSWQEVSQNVFGGDIDYCELVSSYRNTKEIMDFANRVAACFPVKGVHAANPVLRSGKKPEVRCFVSEKEKLDAIAYRVKSWQEEGYFSIALVVQGEKEAKKLQKALAGKVEARLVTPEDQSYEGGVMILPLSMIKGLEFDCLLLTDAGIDAWPEEAWQSKLLYVCCTRPLHRLALYAVGECSRMLGAEEGAMCEVKG